LVPAQDEGSHHAAFDHPDLHEAEATEHLRPRIGEQQSAPRNGGPDKDEPQHEAGGVEQPVERGEGEHVAEDPRRRSVLRAAV
jgi:hypothetical protein